MKKRHPLKKWLAENGVSQAEFARHLGVSQVSISNYVRGKQRPGANRALEISWMTGIDPFALLLRPEETGENQ